MIQSQEVDDEGRRRWPASFCYAVKVLLALILSGQREALRDSVMGGRASTTAEVITCLMTSIITVANTKLGRRKF